MIWELAEKVQSEHGIRVRPMRRRQLRKDIDAFAEVYNAAWSKNWDFVPYSKKDLDAYAQELQLAFDKNWFMIAEKEDTGEVVGMAITVPDLNQVLAQMNGRLLPLGWWKFLTQGPAHRPRARRLPRRQARVPAHGRRRQALRGALQRGRTHAPERRRDGLDPRDQHRDEPRHGSDGRAGRQALPRLRAAARPGPEAPPRAAGGLDAAPDAVRRRDLSRPLHSRRVSEDSQSETLPVAPVQGELVEPRPAAGALEQSRRAAALPAVQAAAAAAGGFVAGAAVVGLVGRHRRRARARRRSPEPRPRPRGSRRNAGAAERLQIVGSRSLLLDVHLLGGSGASR